MATSSDNRDAVISIVHISLVPIGLGLLLGVIGRRFSVGFGKALLIIILAMFISAGIALIGILLGAAVVWFFQ